MEKKKSKLIFVVEDNKIYNHLVSGFLEKKNNLTVKSFLTGQDCIKAIEDGLIPDIVVQDYFLQDITGIEVLQKVKHINPKIEFIFLTANESMEVAVNTIKYGAFDYIIKDKLALDKVTSKIQKIIKILELENRNKQIRKAMIFFGVVIVLFVILAILLLVLGVY